jgi:hypothetical protein
MPGGQRGIVFDAVTGTAVAACVTWITEDRRVAWRRLLVSRLERERALPAGLHLFRPSRASGVVDSRHVLRPVDGLDGGQDRFAVLPGNRTTL